MVIERKELSDSICGNIGKKINSFNSKKYCFVAKENDIVYGISTLYTKNDEVYISDIVVFNEYRNIGIGAKIIERIENDFKNEGFNKIKLVINSYQSPIFFEKCGFKIELIKKNDSFDTLYLIKYL